MTQLLTRPELGVNSAGDYVSKAQPVHTYSPPLPRQHAGAVVTTERTKMASLED